MKKTFVLVLLALLGMTQLAAQDYEYVPFVREGVKWVYWYKNDFTDNRDDYCLCPLPWSYGLCRPS